MPLSDLSLITTPRLVLRDVTDADLPDLMGINGDPQVTQFLPYKTWESELDGVAWLQRMCDLSSTGNAKQLVIARRSDGGVVGTALLFKFDGISRRVELGYVVGRTHWRQGLAREALSALLSHLFGVLGVRRVEAEVNPNNEASNALLDSLGFSCEGYLRERWEAKGVVYGVNIYGLLAREWKPNAA